jgi:hypothetical protein
MTDLRGTERAEGPLAKSIPGRPVVGRTFRNGSAALAQPERLTTGRGRGMEGQSRMTGSSV